MDDYTWKSETIEALKELGGIGHLNDILNKIIERNHLDLSNAKTPARTLSRVLQTYTFSTDYGKENIFYSVYGVKAKKGIWALVDYSLDSIGCTMTFEDDTFSEGKEKIRQHIFRERNPHLIKKAKEKFKMEHDGKLFCEVCGFDFKEKYGNLGEDFIEAHHTKPISEMVDGEKTNINDIVMVCSNCHSMLHRKKPWLKKEDIKDIIKNEEKSK
ncbi:MAG: HNH endonuclease [Oscillospiraceae bacterium]|nr:HNH endonuclease [Oscillospiraceae bacterium]